MSPSDAVAGHDLELDAGERAEHARVDGRTRRRPGRAHHHLALLEIVEGAQVLGPEAAGRDLGVEAAEPDEAARVEARILRIDQRLDGVDRVRHAEHRAVLGRDRREIVGRLERARARHVLEHDVRVAGDVLADVAGEHAQVELEGRARPIADHRLHRPALVEFFRTLLRSRGRCGGEQCGNGKRAGRAESTHQGRHRRLHCRTTSRYDAQSGTAAQGGGAAVERRGGPPRLGGGRASCAKIAENGRTTQENGPCGFATAGR